MNRLPEPPQGRCGTIRWVKTGGARRGALLAVLAFSLFAAAAGTADTAGETARLNAWLNARYEEELQLSPTSLTTLGRKTRYDEIDDFSEAGALARYKLLEQSATELRQQFDYDKLTPEGRNSYDFWVYRLQIFRESLPFLRHEYLFSTEGGLHAELPEFLINLHTVDTAQEMLDYISRIGASARALRQSLERAQLAANDGIRPPRFAYDAVIEIAGKVITGQPFTVGAVNDSPLWADANSKISSLLERNIITPAQATTLRQQSRSALEDSLLPAYRELIAWLQADMPNTAGAAAGVASLPDGAAYYDYCLAYYTTTDLGAAQIYQLGLAEVARIQAEIETLMKQVGFPGTLEQFFHFVRTDQQFYFSNDAAGRDAYVKLSRQHIDTMAKRLPEYFGILPKSELQVKRVEPFMEQAGMAPFYIDGTADGSRPGTYYLHLSDMSGLNTTDLETTAYHETIPGHHLQGAIALEASELPLFRRNIWYSAYGEGWALYAEQLAREMGAFSDHYSDFGRLAGELLRAVRLVVDTGLHARGWSEQQAVDYMLANTALPEVAVRSEVRRYLALPGQATSYTIGMLKLLDLRQQSESALGKRFDIRGFHDTVLGGGSLPLPILQQRIDDWIAGQTVD